MRISGRVGEGRAQPVEGLLRASRARAQDEIGRLAGREIGSEELGGALAALIERALVILEAGGLPARFGVAQQHQAACVVIRAPGHVAPLLLMRSCGNADPVMTSQPRHYRLERRCSELEHLLVAKTHRATAVPVDINLEARFINRELSWLAFNERVLGRGREPARTRCSSGCASCRSRPTTSTSSSWCASPASRATSSPAS